VLAAVIDWERAFRRASEVLADLGFPDFDVRQKVAALSVSRQQIVEIAKAVAMTPRVLILDEPTAVLSVAESGLLFRKIRRLTAAGTLVIYISHRLEEVFQLADRIVVLRDGSLILSKATAELDEVALITAMVGRPLTTLYPPRQAANHGTVLEVSGLSAVGRFGELGFHVAGGEIVGLFGLVGSGRTEMARALFGADDLHTGTVRIDGAAVRIKQPRDAVRHGIALVTEDRKRDGLALDCNMLDNGALASLDEDSHWGIISRRRQTQRVESKLQALAIRPCNLALQVRRLSGGNQQKVVLAKWMLRQGVRVFIFDEPTRGVDVGAKAEIYRLIADIAAAGAAVLLISSELPEVLGMSDRLLVMRAGQIVAELSRAEFSMEAAFGLAAGLGKLQRSA
jgi:ABC-type sugar transport system ATPase subunit